MTVREIGDSFEKVATSIILVIMIVAFVIPNTVQADMPITKYCIDGVLFVAKKKPTVKPY